MIRRISPGAPGSGQPPVIFTTKVTQAATAVTELEAFVAGQQVVITGAAADKDREEEELESAAPVETVDIRLRVDSTSRTARRSATTVRSLPPKCLPQPPSTCWRVRRI
jgi:hypothetical protein